MSDLNMKRFFKMIAYIAVLLIAVALLLQLIFKDINLLNIVRTVGECIAYLVTIIVAFGFVRNRRNPVWAILYAIAVTAIVVLVILR